MSADPSQTAPNSEPPPCKMGCGFFGNSATEGCCSKCWRDLQKSKNECQPAVREEKSKKDEKIADETAAAAEPEPMDAEPATDEKPAAAAATPAKKKKKKTSYKAMMAAMTKATPERDVEKEKEQLRKVTGGGKFSKIDKI